MDKAKRYPTKEITAIEIYGRQGAQVVNMVNLSSTGACLKWTDETLKFSKGDLVRLTVVLNSLNRRRQINGEIVWCKGRATGVAFLTSDQIFEKLIERSI